MGGHGGLNILPQKKWNVYNWDNRIKVMENEKIVNKEIVKMELRRKDKRLEDKVKFIKNPNEKYASSHNVEDYDKNKLFREVMQRQSMAKKCNVDLNFEKMNTPMMKDEQLKLFDDDLNVDKLLHPDEDEKKLTFKESVKSHLNPWYMKRKLEDFEIYREIQQEKKNEEEKEKREEFLMQNMLKRKHKKEEKKKERKREKKLKKDKDYDKNEMIEKLRKERREREKEEKKRINKLLANK